MGNATDWVHNTLICAFKKINVTLCSHANCTLEITKSQFWWLLSWDLKNYEEFYICWKVEMSWFGLSHQPDLWIFFYSPAWFPGISQHLETHKKYAIFEKFSRHVSKVGWKQFSKRYLCLFGKRSGTWKSMSYFEFKGLNDIPVLETKDSLLFKKKNWQRLGFWASKIWIQKKSLIFVPAQMIDSDRPSKDGIDKK